MAQTIMPAYADRVTNGIQKYSGLLKSFAAVVCTALLVSVIYYQHSVRIITDAGERTGITITHAFLNSLDGSLINFFLPADDDETEIVISQETLKDFDDSVRHIMEGTQIEKIKIYGLSGDTLYSTQASQIGENQHNNEGFQSALRGTVSSSLVYRDKFNSMDGIIENKDLVQTYTMVLAPTNNKDILGVFELYTDVTPLIDELESSLIKVLLVVVVILFVLYGLHLWVTIRAQYLIAAQSSEIEEKNRSLQYSRALTESLLDSIQECILFVDPSGMVLKGNRYTKQARKFDPEGKSINKLLSDNVINQDPNEAIKAVYRTFHEAQPQKGILTRNCIDRDRTHTMDTYPVLDAEGIPRQAILYLRDVTDERRSQEQNARHQTLITFGALATGYAHELVNPLTALSTELELLKLRKVPEELSDSFSTQQTLVNRLIEIAQKMRNSFRTSIRDGASSSLPLAIKQAIRQIRHQAAANEIIIKYSVEENLPELPISMENLLMVLINLLQNSIQAMPDSGCISLDARAIESGGIALTIIDTGPGIPTEDRSRVLDALYTTKKDGLGLGLTICNELVQLAGGKLEIDSSAAAGTKIDILFSQFQ